MCAKHRHCLLVFVAFLIAQFLPLLRSQATVSAETMPTYSGLKLLRSYEYVFRLQDKSEILAQQQDDSGNSGELLRNTLQSRLALTPDQFSLFREAALRFNSAGESLEHQRLIASRENTAIDPSHNVLSANTHSKMNELQRAKLKALAKEIDTLHGVLGASNARQLDSYVSKLYSESPVQNKVQTQQLRVTQADTMLGVEAKDTPLYSMPGNNYCTDLTYEEEQDDDDACGDEGGSYDLENCECDTGPEGGGGGSGALCFALLLYRPVKLGPLNSGFNHSFWWAAGSAGTTWIIDAGPSGVCPAACGYLNDQITPGNAGLRYPEDNSNDSLAWAAPYSNEICSQVASLYDYAYDWVNNVTPYTLPIPNTPPAVNSNTFTHGAGTAAGFTPTAPPSAPGW
jgi:hypothetical protein